MKIEKKSTQSREFPKELRKEAHILSEKASHFLIEANSLFVRALNKQRKVTNLFNTSPTEKTEMAALRTFKSRKSRRVA